MFKYLRKQHRPLTLILLLVLLSSSVFSGSVQRTRAAGPSIPACTLTPDKIDGQGFTTGGLGFTTGGLGFTVGGLGFTVGGLGFTTGGLGFTTGGLSLDQIAQEVRDNPITPAWLTSLLPDIQGGVGYNTVKTAVLIVDDFNSTETLPHGAEVEAVFVALKNALNTNKISLFRVDISSGANGFQVSDAASKIAAKVTELQGQGFKHFVINMSFGLIPCSDEGGWALPNGGGEAPPFNFGDFMKAKIAFGNPPAPPNPPLVNPECPVYSPLPQTRIYRNGDTDFITLFGGGPVSYNWVGDIPTDGHRVFGSGSGILFNPGDYIKFTYPDMGTWGPPDSFGAVESHITIHFNGSCGYSGYDWDRFYHTYDDPLQADGLGITRYLVDNLGVPENAVNTYVKHLNDSLQDDQLTDLTDLLNAYLQVSASTPTEFSVIPVASAGNFRPMLGSGPLSPAKLKQTIGVAASLGNFGPLWRFSQDGNVIAPGAGFKLSDQRYLAGTSFASPFVSMASALWLTYPDACVFDGTQPPLKSSATSKFGNAAFVPGGTSPLNCVRNFAPVTENDSYNVDEDITLNVAPSGVLENDSDPEGQPLTASLKAPALHGTLTLNSNGSFTYVPNHHFYGPDGFSYYAVDNKGAKTEALVSITVNQVNHVPVAVGDDYSVDEDGTLNIAAPGVMSNDSDPDEDDTLSVSLLGNVAHGALTLNSNGSFVYKPTEHYFGPDSFSYTLSDGQGGTATAIVNLTVNHVNHAPTAGNDSYSTDEDTALNVAAPGVLGNDHDPDSGDTLTISMIVTNVAHGTLALNANGSFTYTPNEHYFGPDSFTYKISDGHGGDASATVSLNVLHVNHAPTAVGDSYSVNENTTLNVPAPGVLGNDSDPDSGDTLTAALNTGVAHGSLTLNANGSFSYTPANNYYGPDSFSYTLSDGHGGTSTASVSLNVVFVNQPPVAVGDTYSTNENTPLNVPAPGVMGNDSDPDGGSLSVALNTGVAHGSLTLNANGSFGYTPAANFSGQDSFSYTLSDGQGGTASATVKINVAHVNHPPVAVGDNYEVNQDTTLNIGAPGVLGNDSDPDGDGLSAAINTNVAHGTLTLNANGSFSYTPAGGYFGPDSFSYTLNDGQGGTATATVSINVKQVVSSECPKVDLPKTRDWKDGDTDVITLLSGGPITYQWEGTIPTDGNRVFGKGSGVLTNPGDSFTITYPEQGTWGPADRFGAHETHVTIHFTGSCGYFGHDWDRYYHDTTPPAQPPPDQPAPANPAPEATPGQ
jgi:VCBS repeat-containing protein